MSILNKYKRAKNLFHLINDEYYDLVLSQETKKSIPINGYITRNGLISYIDFTDNRCIGDNEFMSTTDFQWEKAINNGVDLKNIGFTGLDNGLIKFDRNTITDEEFKDLLTNTVFHLDSSDFRLHLHPIYSNTQQFNYSYEYINNQYLALKGGFLQGFFKLDGYNYQVLPLGVDNGLNFEIVLRPCDYITENNIINNLYPSNKGIFFYIGTRAENKFSMLYGEDVSKYPDRANFYPYVCDNYFLDNYLKNNDENIDYSGSTPDYSGLTNDDIIDSDGNLITKYPLNEFKSDNKFLLFNHTPSGYTVDTWDENNQFIFQWDKKEIKENMFLLMNHTPSGYTVDTLDKYGKTDAPTGLTVDNLETKSTYSIQSDLFNNCFALKLNDDMSISYRYLIKDCNSDNGFSIIEETSFPNIVTKNEWNVINVKIKMMDSSEQNCETTNHQMKIYIYVNGYLKLVSQMLDAFNFKNLNDSYTKQEGVPYNISLGGGSQGLCDSIWTHYKDILPKVLPIESNFAGSFIGDIKSFKVYSEMLEYNQIKNNYLYEKSLFINAN